VLLGFNGLHVWRLSEAGLWRCPRGTLRGPEPKKLGFSLMGDIGSPAKSSLQPSGSALPEFGRPLMAGPSRHFAATQQFGRFRSEADIERFSVCAGPVALDPIRTRRLLAARP